MTDITLLENSKPFKAREFKKGLLLPPKSLGRGLGSNPILTCHI
jgi:hypothetical protein